MDLEQLEWQIGDQAVAYLAVHVLIAASPLSTSWSYVRQMRNNASLMTPLMNVQRLRCYVSGFSKRQTLFKRNLWRFQSKYCFTSVLFNRYMFAAEVGLLLLLAWLK